MMMMMELDDGKALILADDVGDGGKGVMEEETFVFNESALERILIHNSKLFNKVKFVNSNFYPERRIGIFYK